MIKYTKPYPTLKELFEGKSYDYVSYRGYDAKRNKPPVQYDGTIDGEFCGCFRVENGEIKSLDNDTYYDDETVIASEEWSLPEEGIKRGISVIVEMEFIPAGELYGGQSV